MSRLDDLIMSWAGWVISILVVLLVVVGVAQAIYLRTWAHPIVFLLGLVAIPTLGGTIHWLLEDRE